MGEGRLRLVVLALVPGVSPVAALTDIVLGEQERHSGWHLGAGVEHVSGEAVWIPSIAPWACVSWVVVRCHEIEWNLSLLTLPDKVIEM